jgi:hypothetical protein
MSINAVTGASAENLKESGAHSCLNTDAPLTTITYKEATMASNEGIGSPFLKQSSERSPKLRIYESLFLLNESMDHLVALLREMEKLPLADKESVQCAVVEIEEVRCDMNADFTEKLADSERFDEGRFWKQRQDFEKKWRDPDDVYLEVGRREEERKKRGLAAAPRCSPTFSSGCGRRSLGSRAGTQKRALQEVRKVTV